MPEVKSNSALFCRCGVMSPYPMVEMVVIAQLHRKINECSIDWPCELWIDFTPQPHCNHASAVTAGLMSEHVVGQSLK